MTATKSVQIMMTATLIEIGGDGGGPFAVFQRMPESGTGEMWSDGEKPAAQVPYDGNSFKLRISAPEARALGMLLFEDVRIAISVTPR